MKAKKDFSPQHSLYIKKIRRESVIVWILRISILVAIFGFWELFATLEIIENAFADMMCKIAECCLQTRDKQKLLILSVISKWLYFIDAIDDLDENIAEGTFNPLLKYDFSNATNQSFP